MKLGNLSKTEINIYNTIKQLKSQAGSHSPSIATLVDKIPELKMDVDACFLSNPYATDLFLEKLNNDLISKNKIRPYLEFYPSQNKVLAKVLSETLNISDDYIFLGNGAIEIIHAVLNRFIGKRLLVNIPTFSSYYEFIPDGSDVVYYKLYENENFEIDINKYIDFINQQNITSIVIINPNNPNGGYMERNDIIKILDNLKHLESIIIDESFIHFAFENDALDIVTYGDLIAKYPNLIVIKSMSKDFGIAGIRCGYALMNPSRVSSLLEKGYLWNISGLAEYFFRLYVNTDFQNEYQILRKKYIGETQDFLKNLASIDTIKVYPSKANFALVKLPDGCSSDDFVLFALIRNGVYMRTCSDKIGLEDCNYIRIASRSYDENIKIVNTINSLLQ